MTSRNLVAATATVIAVVLMVLALWTWAGAGALSSEATRPDVQRWAVRSAAVAIAGMSQVLLLTFVAGRVFRPRNVGSDVLRLSVGLVAGVALISAVALGLAGH